MARAAGVDEVHGLHRGNDTDDSAAFRGQVALSAARIDGRARVDDAPPLFASSTPRAGVRGAESV